jgi:hypothetical protein
LNAGSTLVLNANHTYNVSHVRILPDATLQSNAPGTQAIVNVKGTFLTEPTSFLTGLQMNDEAGPGRAVKIGNESILDRVVINVPCGDIHVHTGTRMRGTPSSSH